MIITQLGKCEFSSSGWPKWEDIDILISKNCIYTKNSREPFNPLESLLIRLFIINVTLIYHTCLLLLLFCFSKTLGRIQNGLRLVGKYKATRLEIKVRARSIHSWMNLSVGQRNIGHCDFSLHSLNQDFTWSVLYIYFPSPSLTLIFPWLEVDKKEETMVGIKRRLLLIPKYCLSMVRCLYISWNIILWRCLVSFWNSINSAIDQVCLGPSGSTC